MEDAEEISLFSDLDEEESYIEELRRKARQNVHEKLHQSLSVSLEVERLIEQLRRAMIEIMEDVEEMSLFSFSDVAYICGSSPLHYEVNRVDLDLDKGLDCRMSVGNDSGYQTGSMGRETAIQRTDRILLGSSISGNDVMTQNCMSGRLSSAVDENLKKLLYKFEIQLNQRIESTCFPKSWCNDTAVMDLLCKSC